VLIKPSPWLQQQGLIENTEGKGDCWTAGTGIGRGGTSLGGKGLVPAIVGIVLYLEVRKEKIMRPSRERRNTEGGRTRAELKIRTVASLDRE